MTRMEPTGAFAEGRIVKNAAHWVEIVEHRTDVVVKRIGPCYSERHAEQVERGVNINLAHERFYTRVAEHEKDAT